jgi:hypothetical protein
MKQNNYSYTDMAMINAGISGYQLDDATLDMINSNAGAEVEFDVREDSEFTAAFIAWNSEGRASNPDSEEYPGYANAKSLVEDPATPLDMTKINALKGDWTATAVVNYMNVETGEFSAKEHSWKVTIGDLTSPSSLTSDVYDLFGRYGVSKEETDAHFTAFKEEEERFNTSIASKNRVLCQGWQLDDDRTLSTATPWDLFLMEDYNSSSVSYLYQDFGPKWFLQVNEAGEVFVPVNYNRIPTFTSWYNGMAHHFCMANYTYQYAYPYNPYDSNDVEGVGMPVEISEDGNTFILKSTAIDFINVDENGNPIKDAAGNDVTTTVPFYPNVIYESQQGIAFYNNHVISEVKLTRGWNEPVVASKKSVKGGASISSKIVKPTNVKYTAPNKVYGISTFVPQPKKVKAKVVNAKQVTPEETRKGMESYLKRLYPTRK